MRRSTRQALPGAALFTGTVLGALLGYAFFAVLGRALSADDLGAVGSLVNLATILTVPGLGLQLVTARRVAGAVGAPADRSDLIACALVGGVPGVVLALASPALAQLLHLSSPGPMLAIAVSTVPMTLVYAGMGVLQGTERFIGLGVASFLAGAVKIAAALVALAFGLGVLGVMSWWTVGWVALAAAVGALVPRGGPGDREVWRRGLARAREGVVACVPTAGLFVLSGLDLLLARHHLPRDASGIYTVGALFAKVAFWGPQFVATLYYPRMARSHERARAVRDALVLTAGIGAIGVAVAASAGDLLVRVVGGAAYVADLGSLAWAFTALGTSLALVQVFVYADLARHGHRVGVAVWVTVGAVVAVVTVWHGSVASVVTGVLTCVVALAAVAALLTRGGAPAAPGCPRPPVASDAHAPQGT